MKKVLSILLSLCLLLGLCSCNSAPIEVKKFASETEMQEYLQGAWKSTTLDGNEEYNYIFFNGNQVYIYGYSDDLLTKFKDSFVERIEADGYKAFAALSVTDYVKELETNMLSDSTAECVFKHKKGVAVFKDKYKIYAGNDIIHYAGQDYEKLSDIPTYEAAGITQLFIDAHADYVPPLSLFKLTNEEYAKVLRNKYFANVTQDGSTVHVEYDSIKIKYDTSENLLTVSDRKMSAGMEKLVADALLVFGDAPNVPSAGELVDRFHNEGKTELHTTPTGSLYTTKTLVIDLDDVQLEIHQDRTANDDGFDIVTIRF